MVYAAKLKSIEMALFLVRDTLPKFSPNHLFTDSQTIIQVVEASGCLSGQFLNELNLI